MNMHMSVCMLKIYIFLDNEKLLSFDSLNFILKVLSYNSQVIRIQEEKSTLKEWKEILFGNKT